MKLRRQSRAESRTPSCRAGEAANRRTGFPPAAAAPPCRTQPSPSNPRPPRAAFTLIEIMIVGGIIGMIAAIGAPTLYQMFHRKGMAKLVAEMTDLCTQARTRAILTGDKTRILFFPQERRCVLEGGAVPGAVRLGGNASTEVVFEDSITLSALMIGMIKYDFKDDEVAWVWFYPNGTSDEMSLVVHSDKNEWRVFNLETATGMVTVETDMNKYL